MGGRAPFGVYEGAYAARNPVFTLAPSTVVGAADVIVGRFGWANPTTGQVANSQTAGALGIIQPRPGLWALTYTAPNPAGYGPPVRYLRAGKPCALITCADLYVRFPLGGVSGSPVWVDPATGIAYASNVTGSYLQTIWKLVQNVSPQGLAVISPYQFIS